MTRRYDVCAAVLSDLPYDARVWKEARSLAGAGYRVCLVGCRYGADRVDRRSEHGVDVVEFPLGAAEARERSVIRSAAAVAAVNAEILGTPARAYHAHNFHPALAARSASRLRRATLVYDAHELYGDWGGSGVRARLTASISLGIERLMVKRSDLVITTNPTRAAELTRRHGVRDITVLSNVPYRSETVEAVDPGFPSGSQVLLYQGGIYASRSFLETIQALGMLPGWHFVILGFGRASNIAQVRRWAAAEGVEDRVHVLPPRPFSELVATAAGATVGIVPIRPDNLNNYTGDTNKLHEYLMAGLPVVASDIPEIRRVLADGDPPVGEVFDPLSPRSIADAVLRVTDTPVRYAARRAGARQVALDRYNWQVEERKLLAAYARLLP